MTDPLDMLRAPVTPIDPDPAFASALRERIVRALLAVPGQPTAQEDEMTDAALRADVSRHGTRAGDVSYISLNLPDLARGRAFYGTVLGWTFAAGSSEQGSQVDDVIPQVGLWSGPQASGREVRGAVLGYRVDDLAHAVEAVREQGGTATEPRREPYGLVADCVDDQGVEFYLHELAPAGRPAPESGLQAGDISYISLLVPDADAARRFYAAVLGWQIEQGSPQQTMPLIGIGRGERSGAVLCFRVGDIAATVARVRDAGGIASDPVQRPYALESDGTDDQGTPFYLHQFPS